MFLTTGGTIEQRFDRRVPILFVSHAMRNEWMCVFAKVLVKKRIHSLKKCIHGNAQCVVVTNDECKHYCLFRGQLQRVPLSFWRLQKAQQDVQTSDSFTIESCTCFLTVSNYWCSEQKFDILFILSKCNLSEAIFFYCCGIKRRNDQILSWQNLL